MAETFADILRESCHKGNFIPLGRQLPRTPPLPDVTRRLVFCEEDSVDEQQSPRNEDDNIQNGASEVSALQTKTEPDDHNSMLRGMKGYQLTQSDLDFIRKMQEEKLVKKLQKDLEEAQKLLKKETMAAELAFASREKAQAELRKFPSCEELTEWVSVVLKTTSPSAEVADADVKCLLAAVTADGVRRVLDEKRVELARMERMLANKRKKEAKEKEQLQKRVSSEQLKIQGLMSQLSELKSELTQQEVNLSAHQKYTGGPVLDQRTTRWTLCVLPLQLNLDLSQILNQTLPLNLPACKELAARPESSEDLPPCPRPSCS